MIGAGVGGLSAAIHLRLKGFDVVVLEAGSVAGGKAACIQIGDFRLDPGPSIIILPRIYERLFADAGRNMSDYLVFDRLDPISRVYFEGQIIDLPASRQSCLELIKDKAPQDAKSFQRLMAKLDKVSPHIDKSVFAHPYNEPKDMADWHLVATAMRFNVRLTYKSLVDQMFKTDLLRSFFYGFPSYGGQTYDSKAPGALMIPYLMIEEGVYYPRGGVGAIPIAFEKLARELGVEFSFNEKVESFVTSGGKVSSATSASGKIEGDVFVSNVDRLTTRGWLGQTYDTPPSFSYFTVHWGFKERLDGLGHHCLVVPSGWQRGFEQLYRSRGFPDSPIVYLNETAGHDPTCAPPGGTNLFAVVTSPAMVTHIDWEAETPVYKERIVRTVNDAGIALDPSGAVFERVQTPQYFQSQHGNYRGSLYGPDEKFRLFGGMFPLRNQEEEFSNLFYCGGSVQPGAGLPMVTLSGRFAAEMAAKA